MVKDRRGREGGREEKGKGRRGTRYMATGREESVSMAKLAEQSKRYKEMVEYMEKVTYATREELTVEECNRLSIAYKNVIAARHAS
ncbi:hypothetical protein C4D60_Mb01t32150 [Musa balbisiana]|uniref:14-3-3 domain-containing protein n=1 Tax=Musa balbisiana TaxID=52838 RepID=A0A4S8JS93_MUSBA|nr:hypothetical protein C4D60_Mb01t32150 [Musa balbisiana]